MQLASAESRPTKSRVQRLLAVLISLAAAASFAAPLAHAQDWGDDSSGDWGAQQPAPAQTSTSSRARSSSDRNPAAGWSIQSGIGFTLDPDTFLLNFDAPYFFNQWISFGPAMQIGLTETRTIVSPTGNLRVTIPDLPGTAFDRVHPYGLAGMGFSVIQNDKGPRDGDAAVGLLLDFGVGVEYQVSEKVFLGTQMIFNFLPQKVKREHFYYAWQLAGIRFAF